MISTGTYTSLDLKEAADFLGMHPHTLQAKAKARIIPAFKEGRQYRFIDVDLIAYMRSRTNEEDEACRSTGGAVCGGSSYTTAAEELDARLIPRTNAKRSEKMTSLQRLSGANDTPEKPSFRLLPFGSTRERAAQTKKTQ